MQTCKKALDNKKILQSIKKQNVLLYKTTSSSEKHKVFRKKSDSYEKRSKALFYQSILDKYECEDSSGLGKPSIKS